MKRIVAFAIVVAIAGVGASTAAAAVHAWTASRTERVVAQGARVQLATPQRVALEQELRPELLRYSALAYAAAEMGDSRAAANYHRVATQYQQALSAVVGGIDIAEADCVGSGRVLAAQRFRRFDCLVFSDVLSIPQTELETTAEDALPSFVQGEPRELGPFVTWLRVRVTGSSSFTYE
jgi:hypothetical protein